MNKDLVKINRVFCLHTYSIWVYYINKGCKHFAYTKGVGVYETKLYWKEHGGNRSFKGYY